MPQIGRGRLAFALADPKRVGATAVGEPAPVKTPIQYGWPATSRTELGKMSVYHAGLGLEDTASSETPSSAPGAPCESA
jgi:hypothetical protein